MARSFLGRLQGAIVGVLVGAAVLAGGGVLIWWNEARAVRTDRSLREGLAEVVGTRPDPVDAKLEGRLVHLGGEATTQEVLRDRDLGLARAALRLSREVAMYQWVERRKKGDDGERRAEYRREWSERYHDSRHFLEPHGHENPPMPFRSRTTLANEVDLGPRDVPRALAARIRGGAPVALGEEDRRRMPGDLAGRTRVAEDRFFIGRDREADPLRPRIGDLRVGFREVGPTEVSVMARQAGRSFAPYPTRAGDELFFLHTGRRDAAAMISAELRKNTWTTWGLRLLGWLLLYLGIALVCGPFRVVLEALPLVGGLLASGLSFFAFVCGAALALVLIAAAWMAARPVLAAVLLALAVAALVAGGAGRDLPPRDEPLP